MRTIISSMIVSVVALTVIISCKKQENQCGVKPVTQESIQGNWKDVSDSEGEGHYFYTVYFRGDSFFVDELVVSDAVDTNGLCRNLHNYSKGVFSLSNQKIHLTGSFTDSTFQYAKMAIDSSIDCPYRYVGTFESNRTISYCGDTLVTRMDTSAFDPFLVQCRLIKQ